MCCGEEEFEVRVFLLRAQQKLAAWRVDSFLWAGTKILCIQVNGIIT